jgi:ubiquinone/menaquinone biosynthesis C-methylase UbiE
MVEQTPQVQALLSAISAASPLQKKFLDAAVAQLAPVELNDLEAYLAFCASIPLTTDFLSDCYLTIVADTFEEQRYFLEHGRYRHQSFAEVAGHVYFNDAYMQKYMYGLAISAFLWPNHTALHRFFLSQLPTHKNGHYLEIGPGHGYYFMNAMTRTAYQRFTGVDISKTSLDLTRAILSHYQPENRKDVQLVEADFLAWQPSDAPYDAITMGEVLEHVENPRAFLEKIAALATPDAHIFLTTCVNAPAVDHIYLFRTPEEVETMIAEAGLELREKHYAPYVGKTLEYCRKHALAINVAYVVRKR